MARTIWIFSKSNRWFRNHSKAAIFFWSLGSVIILGFLDYLAGPELGLSLLFLIPVSLTAWYTGFSKAIVISICSTVAILTSDWLLGIRFPQLLFHFWDGFVALTIFFLFSYLLHLLHWYVEQLKQMARIDHLTGIANRRAFFETAENEILRARRSFYPLTIAYIDIDHFKQLNDKKGHAVGDLALSKVAKTIQMNLRATDLVARLGGDEFGVLLPHSNSKVSRSVIQKLEDCLHGLARSFDWPIGFSIGAVTYVRPPKDIDEILVRADQLMYEVKRNGHAGARHEIVDGDLITELESAIFHRT